ncbi:MAG: outer membrane beta-barrel protein [Kangiellaceae bacterium]|nr:outer membrane beta-barrel protein [Kangiellaceae bacterium]
MRVISLITIFIIALFSFNLQAEEAEENKEEEGIWEIGFILGATDVSISDRYTFSNEKESSVSLSAGWELGYHWPKGYHLETSYIVSNDLDLGITDSYDLTQFNVLFGYSYKITDSITFTPKIGFSSWDLDTREGALFNPGPEETFEYDGMDLTYELNLEVPIGYDLTFNLAYENTNFDFGEISIANLGLSFEF